MTQQLIHIDEALQEQLAEWFVVVNEHIVTFIERTERPNFEEVYDETHYHSGETVSSWRLVCTLHWHEGEDVAKLVCDAQRKHHFMNSTFYASDDLYYEIETNSADSRSDAIRWVQTTIKTHVQAFNDVVDIFLEEPESEDTGTEIGAESHAQP